MTMNAAAIRTGQSSTHASFSFERQRFEPIDPLAITEPALPWLGLSLNRRRAQSVATWLSIPRSLRAPHDDPTCLVDDIPVFVEAEGRRELELVVERPTACEHEERGPLAQVQPCTVIRLRPVGRSRRAARQHGTVAVGLF